VLAVTAVVVTVKVAVVAPSLTVTLAGTPADALLSERATGAPPAGAALVNVTVPVEELPPVTLDGFKVTPESAAGSVMVRSDVLVTPAATALIVATVLVETAVVATVNVAVVAPELTVTLGGKVADGLLLERATVVPPAGAAPVRVTVPVEELPPTTLAGLNEIPCSAELARTVRAAVWVTPLKTALIVAFTAPLTAVVVTVNVPVKLPGATVTLAGTAAAA
jgi:hypothetical protein